MRLFTDQLANNISITFPPRRIISLVPSQTELLHDLGLADEVIGITKFCIHPNRWYKSKTKIGGTKTLNLELIRSLKPDLIIGNKEENTQSDIVALQKDFPVWMSDIYTLTDAIKSISQIGALVDRSPEASYLIHLINAGFADLGQLGKRSPCAGKKVLYLIWRHPFMAAGQETFIHDILLNNGFSNAIGLSRYPVLDMDAIVASDPDLIFLSSEPYPFKERHIAELKNAVPNASVRLVDGEMFSWYGSRLVKAVQYFFNFQQKCLE